MRGHPQPENVFTFAFCALRFNLLLPWLAVEAEALRQVSFAHEELIVAAARHGGRNASPCLQAFGARQLRLPFVECPEAFGFQLEGHGHRQGVEGPLARPGAVTSSQLGAHVEGRLRHGHFHPDTALAVLLKPLVVEIGFVPLKTAPIDVLLDGMSPFGHLKGCQPHDRIRSQPVLGVWAMHVSYIERNQEACVSVGAQ